MVRSDAIFYFPSDDVRFANFGRILITADDAAVGDRYSDFNRAMCEAALNEAEQLPLAE